MDWYQLARQSGPYGLHIERNKLENTTRGISLQDGAVGAVITENEVLESWSTGIHFAYGGQGHYVVSNTVRTTRGKGEGLIQGYLGINGMTIIGNRIESNGTPGQLFGIYIGPHCNDAYIAQNSVLGRYQKAAVGVDAAWVNSTSNPNTRHNSGNWDGYTSAGLQRCMITGNFVADQQGRALRYSFTTAAAAAGGSTMYMDGKAVTPVNL